MTSLVLYSTLLGEMVYFVESKATGLIKIGYCGEKNFPDRIKALRCENRDKPIFFLGVIHLEGKNHETFKELRVRKEWFSPGGKLVAYIQANARKLESFREPAFPENQSVCNIELWRWKTGIRKAG